MSFFRDPLVRRLISGTLFAALFVWVAVVYFDVDVEIVRVLLIMSFIFVFGMMAIGFVLSFVVRWLRRDRTGMLGRFREEEKRRNDKATRDDE